MDNLCTTLEKEDSFDRIRRESRERKEMEAAAAKKKEHDRIVEEKRLDKLIVPYLDNLQDQLDKKELIYFWTFPDIPGFIKIKNMTYDGMQKFINKDKDKYINRTVISVGIFFYHNDKITEIHRKLGIYLKVNVSVFPINNECILNGDRTGRDTGFVWYADDFKISKFSFKLVYAVVMSVASGKIAFTTILGISLDYLIQELKQEKIDIGYALIPLASA